MSKSRHTVAEIIGALKAMEAGRKAEDVAREVKIAEAHYLRLKGENSVISMCGSLRKRIPNRRIRRQSADFGCLFMPEVVSKVR